MVKKQPGSVSSDRDLEVNLPELYSYENRVLVAWSFGVASYCNWQQGRTDIFDRKIAINVSMTPIDRLSGILPLVLQKPSTRFQTKVLRSF